VRRYVSTAAPASRTGLARPDRLTALHFGVFNPWCPTSFARRLFAIGGKV